MANNDQQPTVTRPGLTPVPYVIVKRPDGTLVLRHPDELKPAEQKPAEGGK